jgi:hypothetical protein
MVLSEKWKIDGLEGLNTIAAGAEYPGGKSNENENAQNHIRD